MNPIDYDSILNRTLKDVKPSGIRRFFDIANEMDHVISLSVGEPDFSTPWHIRQVGIRSLEEGKTYEFLIFISIVQDTDSRCIYHVQSK